MLLWLIKGHLPNYVRTYLHRTLVDLKRLAPTMIVEPPFGFVGGVCALSILQQMRGVHAAYTDGTSFSTGPVAAAGDDCEQAVLLPDETPLIDK